MCEPITCAFEMTEALLGIARFIKEETEQAAKIISIDWNVNLQRFEVLLSNVGWYWDLEQCTLNINISSPKDTIEWYRHEFMYDGVVFFSLTHEKIVLGEVVDAA